MSKSDSSERLTLYVLDELEGEERREFEAELAASPELRERFRELQEGLYGSSRHLAAESRPELLDGILDKVLVSTSSVRHPKEAGALVLPWGRIMGLAALLMLFLNLFLLTLLNLKGSGEGVVAEETPGLVESPVPSVTESVPSPEETALLARMQRLSSELEEKEARLGQLQSIGQELAAENERVKEHNAAWEREYTRLAARMLPFFDADKGLSRFTVIEMMDLQAYEQNLPRMGFTDLAGRFLTGGENIAGVDPDAFVGPVFEGAGTVSAEPGEAGLNPFARPSTGSSEAADAAQQEAVASGRPAGFTVWRDDEQKGFLDLYNLPSAAEGTQPYLWVRSSDLDPYVAVGQLPELENGTGSFFYSVEEENFTPSEILITAEPLEQVGDIPSGDILLRGP